MKRALPYLTTGHNSKRLILWKMLFFSLLGAYCIFYSPYGINETDGGFITGLAWQIVQGKMLYGDILYVRPPLPVWLRAGELLFLPDGWAIIGERWIFYLKIAAYSWLGACLLLDGHRRWMLAIFGFVVSVHSYPPMAWHTVDGILFSVLGIWCLARQDSSIGIVAGAAAVFAAALCKQSFYPIPLLFAALLLLEKNRRRTGWGIGALLFFAILFYIGLIYNNINIPYFQLTGGAASGSQAIRHGLFDYFRIKPVVALLSLPLLIPALWCFWKKIPLAAAGRAWYAWLLLLCATFAVEVGQRGEFTAPFAQARLMFWVAIFYTMFFVNEHRSLATNATGRNLITLLAICWCASVSWGYNLPILFSTPWVFAAMQISWFFQGAGERAKLQEEKEKRRKELIFKVLRFFQRIIFLRGNAAAMLLVLLLVFRWGYEFIYRDGRRSEMNTALAPVFPQLGGIYSGPETTALYLDLKNLAARYPNFKTLPSFPMANYLTRTYPPLPLDWVVGREINKDEAPIRAALEVYHPVLLIEKRYADQIRTDPEMDLTRRLLLEGTVIGETPNFWVVKSK